MVNDLGKFYLLLLDTDPTNTKTPPLKIKTHGLNFYNGHKNHLNIFQQYNQ